MIKSINELINEPWRRKIKWDVTHEEALKQMEAGTLCFDPALSYETTGYRPITETQGLDFSPLLFKKVGLDRIRTGIYSGLQIGSKHHRDWWMEQYNLCENGFDHKGYRVTGDHYFFLNFYSMLVGKKGQKAGSGREFTHPSFWSLHYEWFHYIELAETFGLDCAALKSRGVGFSEVGASLGVRPFITTPYYNTVYLASYEPYLTGKGIIQKCWTQLDWLNQNSEDGMRRVRQYINQGLHKRASKLNKDNEEFGHMAQISGQIVDKADKLRGDRTDRLIFEESGSNPVLLDTYGVSEALVLPNGQRVGIRIIFGTGGDTEENENAKSRKTKSGLFGLETMFLDPRSFSILPYRHNYNTLKEYVETGFFVPAWRTVINCMDSRGVVNEEAARDYYNKERDKKKGQPEAYLRYCSEYCFTYEEALSRKGSNNFDQAKLAEQRVQIEFLKVTPVPLRGHLSWIKDPTNDKTILGVKFTISDTGTVQVIEEPIKENGQTIRDLYVAGIDSIDMGINDSISGDKGSKFCIVVKKRSYGLSGNQYVCKYIDRPVDVREAYEKAAMMLWWYNCQANIEYTKIGLIGHFRDKGWVRHLMSRPKYALEGQSNNKNATNLIGTQSTPKLIEYGLDLIRDYINDYCENIFFLDMVKQLQDYSYELKGKFDIVAAMQMCEIGDQDMMGITPKKQEQRKWRDVGTWTDNRGIKHYGVIPNKENNNEYLFGLH